jgi:hypothetical protein
MLSGVLMAPIVLRGEDHTKRYYDPYYRDYHTWNDGEEHAWRHWREQERHERYREWERANSREHRDYWRWRHDHPDWH